jgi:predicted SpoU family rRNA methylase
MKRKTEVTKKGENVRRKKEITYRVTLVAVTGPRTTVSVTLSVCEDTTVEQEIRCLVFCFGGSLQTREVVSLGPRGGEAACSSSSGICNQSD